MLGICVFSIFLAAGVLQGFVCFRRKNIFIRLWLGLTAGLVEMMWLPSLFAFAFDFTLTAQLFALGTVLVSTAVLVAVKGISSEETALKGPSKWLMLSLVLLIAVPVGYLQYTHTFRSLDGALYVGQSTYGDLCMHVSFATGLIGQTYPAEYSILPGTTLGYPYLVDAMSSTMLIFGSSIQQAFAVPGTVMTVLVYLGFFLFAYEVTGKTAPSIVSLVLLFFNGGFGFLYTLDRAGETGYQAFSNALNGYYQTPTNMPDLNLRWVNALCDLLIPQRTLLAGWVCLIPALWLLYSAMRTRKLKDFALLGVLGGSMVMIHTHSFLALAVISLGALIDRMIRDKGHRGKDLGLFTVYGAIAFLLSFPQLITWTFPQSLSGGSIQELLTGNSDGSVKLLFNWVNNTGNGNLIDLVRGLLGKGEKVVLRDGYFWFWLKNVGPMYLLLPIAAVTSKNKRAKALALGALLVYLLAENVVFQPNIYDNNKLFYAAYLAVLPLGSALACDVFGRFKGIRGRYVLAAAFVFVCTVSGFISIWREARSSYGIFTREEREAAEFISEQTPQDSLFLTANNHNNVPAVLGGRKIVCGSGLYLYWHGLDYSRREADAAAMLAYPELRQEEYESYGVDYVYVSPYERTGNCNADELALQELYPMVYEGGEGYNSVRIYAVSERAREKCVNK